MSAPRICLQTGKRQLKRHEADRVVTMAGKWTHGMAQVPVSAFRCPDCRKWHTSGMTQLEYRVRQLVRAAA